MFKCKTFNQLIVLILVAINCVELQIVKVTFSYSRPASCKPPFK